MSANKIVVTGAGGFIGGHLVQQLVAEGDASVTAVDIKPIHEWFQLDPRVENISLDLRDLAACRAVMTGASVVYNLAADMGGMGFIERHKALCMLSVLVNTHSLMAAREAGVRRYFYASSACVYNTSKQASPGNPGLAEDDAYPAMPEDGYGWEKLFSERMCRHFSEDFGIETRVARYHNVYGPYGTYDGGREKAPAAICRKVIQAKMSGENRIAIWGDGLQTRSFTYITDCLEGTRRLMNSEVRDPLNIGSAEMVSINRLVDLVEEIAGVRVIRQYDLDAPKGVRGRNSDNSQVRRLLDWEPSTTLLIGLERTYQWIYDQVSRGSRSRSSVQVQRTG